MKQTTMDKLEIGEYFRFREAIFKVTSFISDMTGRCSCLTTGNMYYEHNYTFGRDETKIEILDENEAKLYQLIS